MDAVDRMFHVLVRTMRAENPPTDGRTFSAGDLHDRILPYRHFRRELGILTNRDYELALMTLLAGERGYLDVDERLRDVLGRELKAPSPDPARLRDVADGEARLNPTRKAAVHDVRTSGPSAVMAECRYCGAHLPTGRALHFCPTCGLDLQVRNCLACGAEVEADWTYCVACGKAAPETP